MLSTLTFLICLLESQTSEFVEMMVVYETENVPFDEDEEHKKIVIAEGIERDTDEWEDAWESYWSNLWGDKYQLLSFLSDGDHDVKVSEIIVTAE